jgi:predicted aspartyl protease
MLSALATVTCLLLAAAAAAAGTLPTAGDVQPPAPVLVANGVTGAAVPGAGTGPAVVSLPSAAAPLNIVPIDPAEQLLFAVPTTLDRIGRIVIPVTINGQGPFRFMVDTGASHSTISPLLVQKLGLSLSGELSIELNGITGTAQVQGVKIDTLQAGDLTIQGSEFPVVWAQVMGGADGILGAAGLKEDRLFVDFIHNRVVITKANRTATPAGFQKISATRIKGGLVAVDAYIGGLKVTAVIDTGSERTLANQALQQALFARGGLTPVRRVTNVYGATSDVVPGDTRVAPTIAIGNIRIADVPITTGDFHIFKVWQMEDRPALIIGMDILGTMPSIAIDFQHQAMFVGGARVLGGGDPGDTSIVGGPARHR